MKIIHCPKGGKVPQGYCMSSCLNYREKHQKIRKQNLQEFAGGLKDRLREQNPELRLLIVQKSRLSATDFGRRSGLAYEL